MKCNALSPNIQNSCVTLTLTHPAFLVYVDQIYRTRSDRAYCRNLGIRITVPPLDRPVPDDLATIRKQPLADAKVRNQIEGKFGQAKQRFSLNRVMTELANTSETAIAITFLVMNLEALLKGSISVMQIG